jgi:LysR family transcriptional regulator, pca operon transcriptional activator
VLADQTTVWIISRGVVAQDLAEGRLVALDIDTAPTLGAVGVMSLADEVPSAAARAFSRALDRVATDQKHFTGG